MLLKRKRYRKNIFFVTFFSYKFAIILKMMYNIQIYNVLYLQFIFLGGESMSNQIKQECVSLRKQLMEKEFFQNECNAA